MSRRDQLFQAVDAVQGRVLDLIDTHVDTSRLTGSSSSSSAAAAAGRTQASSLSTSQARVSAGPAGPGLGRSNSVATTAPPIYQRQSEPGAETLPDAALYAPPGQAQMIVDQMPRSRIVRGSGREARHAAAMLREEQLRSGQLKIRHTFVSSSGRVLMDVHTVPQKHLTFMGGTAQRGRGAMKGIVTLNAQPNERVSCIRLKIKAVVRVLVPKASSPKEPFVLENSHPQVEPSVEKELLVLQLETQLYTAQAAARGSHVDPTMLAAGKHDFPFTVDLPAESSKGNQLPPSFVLAPTNTPEQVPRPQPTSKWETLQSSINMPHLSKDWASVKWYAKLTVERPGMLRTNDRIFAPFVYLPPPPSFRGAEEHLLRRLRLANEVDSLLTKFKQNNGSRPIDLQKLTEPSSTWESFPLNHGVSNRGKQKAQPVDSKADKPSLFSKIMFGAQVEPTVEAESAHESWTLSMPKRPFVFALRSGVPYILSRKIAWNGKGPLSSDRLTRPPNVGIYQRANVYARGKGPVAGTTARFVCGGTQPSDRTPVSVTDEQYAGRASGKLPANRQIEHWLGIVDLPPSCTPCFETPILTLDYYLGVRSPTTGDMLHCEPVVLVCPPSKPARVQASMTPQYLANPVIARPSHGADMSPSQSRNGSSQAARVQSSKAGGVLNHKVTAVPPPVRQEHQTATFNGVVNGQQQPTASTSRVPSQLSSAVHASGETRRPVPARPAIPPSEKAAQPQLDERLHARTELAVANPPSRTQTPRLPSAAHASTSNHDSAPNPHLRASVTQQAEPLTPIRGNTPAPEERHRLQGDDGGSGDQPDPDQWAFVDDELTDMPPSYFEATGQRDDD